MNINLKSDFNQITKAEKNLATQEKNLEKTQSKFDKENAKYERFTEKFNSVNSSIETLEKSSEKPVEGQIGEEKPVEEKETQSPKGEETSQEPKQEVAVSKKASKASDEIAKLRAEAKKLMAEKEKIEQKQQELQQNLDIAKENVEEAKAEKVEKEEIYDGNVGEDKTERNEIKSEMEDKREQAMLQKETFDGVVASIVKGLTVNGIFGQVNDAFTEIMDNSIDQKIAKLDSATEFRTKSYAGDATSVKSEMSGLVKNYSAQLAIMNEGVEIARNGLVNVTTGVSAGIGTVLGGPVGGAIAGAAADGLTTFAVELDKAAFNDETGPDGKKLTQGEWENIFKKTATGIVVGGLTGALGAAANSIAGKLTPVIEKAAAKLGAAFAGQVISNNTATFAKELLVRNVADVVAQIVDNIGKAEGEKKDIDLHFSQNLLSSAFATVGSAIGGSIGSAVKEANTSIADTVGNSLATATDVLADKLT